MISSKKLFLFIPLAAFFISCSSSFKLLQEPMIVKKGIWKVEISTLRAGPDEYSTSSGYWKNQTNSYYKPASPNNGYIWIDITMRNTSTVVRSVDFHRLRIIGDTYVTNPTFVYSDDLLELKKGYTHTLKPGESISQWLIFLYEKGKYPYKIVYDTFKGKMLERFIIDLPEFKIEEAGK